MSAATPGDAHQYFLANHVPRTECDMHIELDICDALR